MHSPLLFFKFYNILNPAIKGVAKRIKRFCADCFAFFYSVQGVSRKALLKYQIIFSKSATKQCFVKRFIANHYYHQVNNIILKFLTMLNILSTILVI